MTISLKHAFHSAKGDPGDVTLVRPSNWNEEHDLTLAANKVIGRAGTSGAAQELTFTAFAQSLSACADAAAVLALLGATSYAEGTWTPGLEFGGGSTGLTYTSRLGTYTKIGRVVYFEGYVQINSNGSSTGDTLLTGLPFTVGGTVSPIFQIIAEGTGIDTTDETSFYLYGKGLPGEDGVALYFNADNDSENLGEWFFNDGSNVTISGHYIVDP